MSIILCRLCVMCQSVRVRRNRFVSQCGTLRRVVLRVYVAMLHGEVMPQTTDLIGTTEAARILGKSPRTVHRMVADGRLTVAHTAPGGYVGVWLFDRAHIEALAKAAA